MTNNPSFGLSGASPARPRDPEELQAQSELDFATASSEETASSEDMNMVANNEPEPTRVYSDELSQRDRMLGTVQPDNTEVPVEPKLAKRVTDKFFGALGLFLLRVGLAIVIAVIGWQVLTDQTGYTAGLVGGGIPEDYAGIVALVCGIGLLVTTILLILGWCTRVVSAFATAGSIAVLVLFRFGPFNPVMPGSSGFYGDRDLLITLIFFLLVMLGPGGWSVDYAYRRGRQKSKLEQL